MKRIGALRRLYKVIDAVNVAVDKEVVELLIAAAFIAGRREQIRDEIKEAKDVVRKLSGGSSGAGRGKRKAVGTKTV